MDRYFTLKPKFNEPRTHVSSEASTTTQKAIRVEFSPNDTIADLGLRQLIEEHVVELEIKFRGCIY